MCVLHIRCAVIRDRNGRGGKDLVCHTSLNKDDDEGKVSLATGGFEHPVSTWPRRDLWRGGVSFLLLSISLLVLSSPMRERSLPLL